MVWEPKKQAWEQMHGPELVTVKEVHLGNFRASELGRQLVWTWVLLVLCFFLLTVVFIVMALLPVKWKTVVDVLVGISAIGVLCIGSMIRKLEVDRFLAGVMCERARATGQLIPADLIPGRSDLEGRIKKRGRP